MSDFDFDEIDKAVNTALGTEPSSDTLEVIQPDTPTVSPATPPEPAVSTAQVDSKASPLSPTTTRRSSGRFMDMVHPSSDMRSGSPAPVSPPVQTKPEEVARPAQTVEPYTPSKDESDDIFSGMSFEEPSYADETSLEDEASVWTRPLESPFIPDAKVEKRPLGGEAPTAHEFTPDEMLDEPDEPRLEAHTMPDPIAFAELSQSEEANEPVVEPEPEEIPLPDLHLHEDSQESEADESVEPKPSVVATTRYTPASPQASSPVSHQPAGQASIPQQYIEKPREEIETGAIYDTEAYHQPLVHTPKKHAGMFVIVWVILLILLGGAAGAAVYFYVLPAL